MNKQIDDTGPAERSWNVWIFLDLVVFLNDKSKSDQIAEQTNDLGLSIWENLGCSVPGQSCQKWKTWTQTFLVKRCWKYDVNCKHVIFELVWGFRKGTPRTPIKSINQTRGNNIIMKPWPFQAKTLCGNTWLRTCRREWQELANCWGTMKPVANRGDTCLATWRLENQQRAKS